MSSLQPPSKGPGIAAVYSHTNLYSLETKTLLNSFNFTSIGYNGLRPNVEKTGFTHKH